MQVISFLSAKGGTGKTTFNMLFASYLRYILGKKVFVIDFDAPENNFATKREREVDSLLEKNPDADTAAFYPVRQIKATSQEGIREVIREMKGLDGKYDYVIIDCPGSMSENDATALLTANKVIDFAAIPTDVDGMSIASRFALGAACHTFGLPFMIFFNRVVWQEKKDIYESFKGMFTEGGMTVPDIRIRHTVKLRRDSEL